MQKKQTPWRPQWSSQDRLGRVAAFREQLERRRSIRAFDPDRIPPLEIVTEAVRAAASAPSGANMQPWHFSVVRDPEIKSRIRDGAEAEERENYAHRMGAEMLAAVSSLGTTPMKLFLEQAPYLIVVFRQAWGIEATPTGDQQRRKHFYTTESVGIAVGFLIVALHSAGLSSLTHTPSPMRFLNDILDRPANERPFVLMPVGYPAADATVPPLLRKPLDAVMEIH